MDTDEYSKGEKVVFTEEIEKYLTIVFILLLVSLLGHNTSSAVLAFVLIKVILRALTGILDMRRSNFGIPKN